MTSAHFADFAPEPVPAPEPSRVPLSSDDEPVQPKSTPSEAPEESSTPR